MIKKYNEYLIDAILENSSLDEVFLIISDELHSILKHIKHPISRRIIDYSQHGNSFNRKHFKFTFLDIAEKVNEDGEKILDLISFISSNKVIQNAAKELNIDIKDKDEMNKKFHDIIVNVYNNRKYYSNLGRSETTIGRLVNKLFEREFPASGNPGNDIESFVNLYKTVRNPNTNFEIVSGNDIIHWYNKNQYSEGGPLSDSCMKYDRCSEYINFYAKNPNSVSLLILRDNIDENKICGRALVWKLNNPSGRYYMDRIFYTSDFIINLFKKYAEKNGWIYKINQNNDQNGPFYDTKTNEELYGFHMSVEMDDNDKYPYLDTLKYYTNGILTNIEQETYDKKLTKTDGSYRQQGIWSDYYDEYINLDDGNYHLCLFNSEYREDDDCFYSEFYDGYISNDFADDNGVWCTYSQDPGDSWRNDGDYVRLANGNTSDREYANDTFQFSEYLNKYVYDGVWSNYYNGLLEKNKSVKIYLNLEKTITDWRLRNDSTYHTLSDGNYYDNNVGE